MCMYVCTMFLVCTISHDQAHFYYTLLCIYVYTTFLVYNLAWSSSLLLHFVMYVPYFLCVQSCMYVPIFLCVQSRMIKLTSTTLCGAAFGQVWALAQELIHCAPWIMQELHKADWWITCRPRSRASCLFSNLHLIHHVCCNVSKRCGSAKGH
jgi:hypothetical protein